MKHCSHSHWLSPGAEGTDNILVKSDRLQALINHIPSSNIQYPSLIVLIGSAAKSIALQQFIPERSRKSRCRKGWGDIHLNLDPSSAFHDRPILFADGNLHKHGVLHRDLPIAACHEISRWILPRSQKAVRGPTRHEAEDIIYSRLLHPFTDVFCFFAADFGGFRPIAHHLASWLDKGRPSTLPTSSLPRIIIVTESSTPGSRAEREAKKIFLDILGEETTKSISDSFSDVGMVALLPKGYISPQARHRPLKERLMKGSDRVRIGRVEGQALFSTRHFTAFFDIACDHFTESFTKPFDFIKASRLRNPVPSDLNHHLTNFLKNIVSPKEVMEFSIPAIASSLLLDNYPPGMHLFNPKEVFHVLYRDVCSQVGKTGVLNHKGSRNMLLPSSFANLIQGHFQRGFDSLAEDPGRSSAQIHLHNLNKFKERWVQHRSGNTCLVCLQRRPQYGLPCGHCVCENCVIIFGHPALHNVWDFEVHNCFLCGLQTPDVVVRVHPPTAGVGVLLIDGGGTRGVVPSAILKIIQDKIGLPIPMQRFFKVAFGTSAGGLIILAMFINGWSINDCANAFERLAKVAFRPRRVSCIPIISHIQKFLMSYLTDGVYPVENIESALKEVFGSEKSILDYSYATSIGARIGLPVTTIRDSLPCIFTNYNGVGERGQNCGYHVVRPEAGFEGVPVWEIARGSSAAPWYFQPKHIRGVGTFQDGGLKTNNPLYPALSEVKAIYPLIEEPDFVVSLGTGSQRVHVDPPNLSGPRGILRDGAFCRMYNSFVSSFRGITPWIEYLSLAKSNNTGQYFRLDIEFDGTEPRMDDTSKMQELKAKVWEDLALSKTVDDIVDCLIASLFYFELESTPKELNGQRLVTGYILCFLPDNDPALKDLLDQLTKGSARFLIGSSPIPGITGDRSFIDKEGNFRKRIECKAGDKLSISLERGGNSQPKGISGSPFNIERLVSAQNLDAHFGRVDHGKRKLSSDAELSLRKRRRVSN